MDEKLAAQELKARAERDTLTRLYNKESARQRIEHLLVNREEGEGAALFVIDIDNFKMVHDQYGHIAGDAGAHKDCRTAFPAVSQQRHCLQD
ncbi:MAG: GGDEF domain-containing protein [Enterocloster bolteae]